MKKLILVVLAVFLMSGIATAATTLELKGSFRIYPEMNNIGYPPGGSLPDYLPNYLNNPQFNTATDIATRAAYKGKANQSNLIDQRTRMIFNVKSDENVGGTVHFEMDSRWGGTALAVGRGADGGALGSDTVNLETKESYLWFKAGALTVKAGIQTWADDMAGIFIGGGDMAGFRADYALSKASSFSTGVFTFFDPNARNTDGVYFVPLTVKQQLGGGTAALFVYTIQDNSNYLAANTAGRRPIMNVAPVTGVATGAPYESAQLYYTGLNYGGKAGNVSYYLMGAYNFGTINNIGTLGGTSNFDLKVKAFAANARADVKIGAGNLRLNTLYVQGNDSKSADEYPGFVAGEMYQGHMSMVLLQTDLVLILGNTDMVNGATFLLPNVNNNGDGVQLGYLAYDYNITPKLNAKAVVGYAAADKKNEALRKGKGMGTEYNAQLKYLLYDNMTIAGVASYAQIGDYFNTATVEADNAYKLLLKFIYLF
jgi:hypothetical protein